MILSILLLSLLIRLYTISDQSIMFWYDQARDLARVQEIISGNLKIQGPSASGTNDTIYHGVFYYYYILPWVWLGCGNPIVVNLALAIIGSFSVLLIYALTNKIMISRKIAILVAFLFSLSFLHAQLSTWMSNPQTLVFSLPLFYYCFWLVFFSHKSLLAIIGLAIGLSLSVHAGIFELHLVVPVTLAYFYQAWRSKSLFWWSWKEIIVFVTTNLILLSPMILTQYLLISRGVLDLSNPQFQSAKSINLLDSLLNGLKLYWQYSVQVLTPNQPYLLVIFVYPIYLAWRNLSVRKMVFFALLFLSPLFLLLLQQRNSSHLLIGVEVFIYALLAMGVSLLWKGVRWQKILAYLLISIFIVTNLLSHLQAYQKKNTYFAIQKGSLLKEQLALIDYTYKKAINKQFTFSSSTNPFAINITWGYLYKHYGMKNYGYLPNFVGPDQIGLVGQDFLPRSEKPASLHFIILEPDTGLNKRMAEIFMGEQDSYSTLIEEVKFGSLILQVRQAK